MADTPEKTLLHYRLAEKIGEGGMGAVWKAVDTTLNREVAVKLLPDLFSRDPDRLARFEREARLLASLNHPNIAGIYGIHEDAGTRFLAMELIEGEDLAEKLARGPLSREETLRAALQIAQALETAHESGVIHRDLKPANIKMTPDGTVKVLDFGLAKAFSPDSSADGGNASLSPTLTSAGTMVGMILGTASYMSPEQAKGKPVDRRADIWSFGVVIFEMLAGRRVFKGETISETLAAVMMKDIDWGALPADTPPRLRRLLQRCLQRDPASRLRDIGDARIAIEETLQDPDGGEIAASLERPRPLWISVAPWLIATVALAALIFMNLSSGTGRASLPVMRFTMAIPEEQALIPVPVPTMALSPDGTRIVFAGVGPTGPMLYQRPIHQQEAVVINGTEEGDTPFFSPDGQWIGFAQDGKLKKISVFGGPPTTLCAAPRLRGASWGADGSIVFAPDRASGLMRVSEAGGTPEVLTTLEHDSSTISAPSHRWPEILPGSDTVLFTSTTNNSNYADAEIVALSLTDMQQKTVIKGGTQPRFVSPGFLVFVREQTLFAARFDPEQVELQSQPVPVLEGITYSRFWGSTQLTYSASGTLVYLQGTGSSGIDETLVWLADDGTETPASASVRPYGGMSFSPDGRHVAVDVMSEESSDIWILELERDTFTRLTFSDFLDQNPVWSPDGEWIVFSSLRDEAALNLYRKRANGTGEVERLSTSDNVQAARSWSPDGSVLAFSERGGDTGDDIMLMRFGPEITTEVFLQTPYFEGDSAISPDGRWLAYTSNESGYFEIYVRPLDGPGGQVKISTNGGARPRWTLGGKELQFVHIDRDSIEERRLMAVAMSVEDGSLRPQLPRPLFDYPTRYSSRRSISPETGRILARKDVEVVEDVERLPTVVVNWVDELAVKVPEGS